MSSSKVMTLTLFLFAFRAAGSSSSSPSACGPFVPYETPSCSVFSREFGYELRKYPAGQNYVELQMPNTTYETASTVGFLLLAAYLKGDNAHGLQIPMSLPFIVHPEDNCYTVALFVSSKFAGTNLPLPNNRNIRIKQTDDSFQAVLGPFTASTVNETSYLHGTRDLLRCLQRDRVDYNPASVFYARYSNPLEIDNFSEIFQQQEVHIQIHLD